MRVIDVLTNPTIVEEICILQSQCSEFIIESDGHPLIKNLPSSYNDFHKVKVRKRKSQDGFTEAFNDAFEDEHQSLRQRSIFANGISSYQMHEDTSVEPFYVFPINGFKFMYSREVEYSDQDYKQVFESVFEQLGDEKGHDVLTDLLRFTYVSANLAEGIDSGAEIILYGIPYYYAIKAESYPSYQDLLTYIDEIM